MKIGRLVIMEILHRRGNFLLGLISVSVAVATLIGSVVLLKTCDVRTERILQAKQAQTEEKMGQMEEDVKDAMLRLGFNVIILPKDQNLGDWHNDNYGSTLMPQRYVDLLADSKIVTIEHIVPRLRRGFEWPETKWTVIIVGTTDDVIYPSDTAERIFVESVPQGKITLGFEVHNGLDIKAGQKVTLAGREFAVHQCDGQRGTMDDMTIWMSLSDAQQLLNKKDMINEILAVQCRSSWANLPKVQAEIAAVLPDTQVVEKASDTLAKVHARGKMAEEAKASIERERANFAHIRARQKSFASVLVPLVLLVCTAWTAMLSFANVRQRGAEIGILRAVGFGTEHVLRLFLSRSTAMGICGGLAGYVAGISLGPLAPAGELAQVAKAGLFVFDVNLLALALFVAVVITSVAGGVAALVAAAKDPAVILSEN